MLTTMDAFFDAGRQRGNNVDIKCKTYAYGTGILFLAIRYQNMGSLFTIDGHVTGMTPKWLACINDS
jgi:hypothetical protein